MDPKRILVSGHSNGGQFIVEGIAILIFKNSQDRAHGFFQPIFQILSLRLLPSPDTLRYKV